MRDSKRKVGAMELPPRSPFSSSWPLLLALLIGCGRTPLDELPSAAQPGRPDAAINAGGSTGTGGAPDTGGTGGVPDTGATGGSAGSGGTGGAPDTGGTGGSAPRPDAATDQLPDAPEPPPRALCPPSVQTQPRRSVRLVGTV